MWAREKRGILRIENRLHGDCVMQKFYVIGYRIFGNSIVFYRGDFRPRIRLGPVDQLAQGGWVREAAAARLFVRFPVFTGSKNIHSSLNAQRIVVYDYLEMVSPTNIILPNS